MNSDKRQRDRSTSHSSVEVMNEAMRLQEREKMNSPFTFKWGDDPFASDDKGLDPVPFMDGNDSSLSDGGADLRGDMLDSSDGNSFPEPDAVVDLISDVNVAPAATIDKPKPISSRKRSLNSSENSQSDGVVSRRKKKPKGMPKRPLSAYNLYFQSERAKILAATESEGGKIGFEGLGKIIGKKWREVNPDERKVYEELAKKDSTRYRKEMEVYNERKSKKRDDEKQKQGSSYAETSSNTSGMDQVGAQPQTSKPFDFSAAAFQGHPNSSTSFKAEESYAPQPLAQTTLSASAQEFARSQVALPTRPAAVQAGPQTFSNFVPADPPQVAYQLQFNKAVQPSQQTSLSNTSAPPVPQFSSITVPTPPVGAEQVSPPSSFPMPPGMEIYLNERKYRVQYACYSMARDAAKQYVESFTGAPAEGSRPTAQSSQQPKLQCSADIVQDYRF